MFKVWDFIFFLKKHKIKMSHLFKVSLNMKMTLFTPKIREEDIMPSFPPMLSHHIQVKYCTCIEASLWFWGLIHVICIYRGAFICIVYLSVEHLFAQFPTFFFCNRDKNIVYLLVGILLLARWIYYLDLCRCKGPNLGLCNYVFLA
jgi:hypothetical protein